MKRHGDGKKINRFRMGLDLLYERIRKDLCTTVKVYDRKDYSQEELSALIPKR